MAHPPLAPKVSLRAGPACGVLRAALGRWFGAAGRDLPWRRTHDPYAILVSEMMLQQTQVATVVPYFTRWLERFPTVQALAAADEAEVLAHGRASGITRGRAICIGRRERWWSIGGAMPVTWPHCDAAGGRALHGGGDREVCVRSAGGGGGCEYRAGAGAAVRFARADRYAARAGGALGGGAAAAAECGRAAAQFGVDGAGRARVPAAPAALSRLPGAALLPGAEPGSLPVKKHRARR